MKHLINFLPAVFPSDKRFTDADILAVTPYPVPAGATFPDGTPILVRANGKVEQVKAIGLPLGIEANEEYRQIGFQLEPGDTLLMTTDGITEARNGNNFLDTGGLINLAIAGNGSTLAEMAGTIMKGTHDFAGGKLRDDASMVLVRRTATSPSKELRHSEVSAR